MRRVLVPALAALFGVSAVGLDWHAEQSSSGLPVPTGWSGPLVRTSSTVWRRWTGSPARRDWF